MIVSRDSIQETTTDMFPDISDHNSLLIALMVVSLVGLFWWWNRSAKKWIEKREQEAWPTSLDWLLRDTQRKPAKPLKYSEQEFQEMVATALDEVPEEFDKEWNNVAVIVSTDWPTDADKKRMRVPEGHLVFGTYSGIDRTKGFRAESGSRHVIVVYQPAL